MCARCPRPEVHLGVILQFSSWLKPGLFIWWRGRERWRDRKCWHRFPGENFEGWGFLSLCVLSLRNSSDQTQTNYCLQKALTTKDLRAIINSSEWICNTATWSQRSFSHPRCPMVLGLQGKRVQKEPHTAVGTLSLDQRCHHVLSGSGKLTYFSLARGRLDGGICLGEEPRQAKGTKHPSRHRSHQSVMSTSHLGHQRSCWPTMVKTGQLWVFLQDSFIAHKCSI